MCPVIMALKTKNNISCKVCITGQHKEMLMPVLKLFRVEPDYNLSIMRSEQTLDDIAAAILKSFGEVLDKECPDVVLVHGDTSSTFVSALAAFYRKIPVGHVEAGLRTGNIYSPYPEEFNRQAVGLIARYHFAPTSRAKENLLAEGKDEKNIWVTGNTVIDALKSTVYRDYANENLKWAEGSRLILITAHRRENWGEPMRRMFRAIRRVVDENSDLKAIYPMHRNPKVREVAEEILGGHERIRLVEPLDVLDFHNFISRSYLILTDSGGIQEEAPTFGVPVLVMRDTTERPEGIAAGTCRLVGTYEESIYRSFTELVSDPEEYKKMSQAVNPYGDGKASIRIAEVLEGMTQTN